MQLQRPFHMSPIRSNIGKLPNTTHFSRTSPLCHETRITAGRRLRPLVESGHQRIDHPTGSAIPVGQRTIHPGTEQHTATPQDTARSSYRLAWALRSQHHPWEPPVHSHSNPPGSQRKLTASEYHTLSPLKPTHSPSTGRGSFWPSTGAAHFRNHISSHSHQWLSGPEGPRARRRTGSRGQYQKRQFQRTVRLRNSPQRPTVLEARLGIAEYALGYCEAARAPSLSSGEGVLRELGLQPQRVREVAQEGCRSGGGLCLRTALAPSDWDAADGSRLVTARPAPGIGTSALMRRQRDRLGRTSAGQGHKRCLYPWAREAHMPCGHDSWARTGPPPPVLRPQVLRVEQLGTWNT